MGAESLCPAQELTRLSGKQAFARRLLEVILCAFIWLSMPVS
jgi:hypothetical protein